MKNRLFFLLPILILFSCDPMDNRMVFKNHSSENVFTRMMFIGNEAKGTMIGLRKIKAEEQSTLGKLYSWESEFENANDSILNVIVFKDYDFLNDKYEASNKIKSDSLLVSGDYQIRAYTYAELESLQWEVNYPEDGFEKGSPLKIGDEKQKNLKPDPQILKEKAIEEFIEKNDECDLQGVADIYYELEDEHRRTQFLYDKETKHSINTEKQKEWDEQINNLLEKYEDYELNVDIDDLELE